MRKGKNNPFYGKTHSEETLRKNIEFHIEYSKRAEVRERLRQQAKNQKPSNPSRLNKILYKICNDEGIEFIYEYSIDLIHKD